MDEMHTAGSLRKTRFPSRRVAALLSLGLALAGCGTTMEDGYKPHVLGATPEARKSYYASPFTDQAEAGSHEASPAVHAGPK